RPLLGDDSMVGVWLPPAAGCAITNIALAFLGKTAVTLNCSASPDIVQSSMRPCDILKVLTSRLFTHKVPFDPGPGIDVMHLDDLRKQITKAERLRSLLSVWLFPGWVQDRLILGLGQHSMDQVVTVIFSSGSTGEPKGVLLTHANIAANSESCKQAIDPGPGDRLIGILPFFHSFGYTVTFWVPLQVGACTIYHPNPLQAREIGELCCQHRCTIFLATPTFLRTYLRRCEPDDFKSVRLMWCGAEKMPPALADAFQTRFGVLPLEGYGCTELSPAAAA